MSISSVFGRAVIVGAICVASGSVLPATAHAATPVAPAPLAGDIRPDLGSPITLTLVQVPLGQALQMIAAAGQFTICYEVGQVPVQQKVNLRIQNAPAEEALRSVLLGSGLGIQVRSNGVVVIVEDSIAPNTETRPSAPQRCTGTVRRDS